MDATLRELLKLTGELAVPPCWALSGNHLERPRLGGGCFWDLLGCGLVVSHGRVGSQSPADPALVYPAVLPQARPPGVFAILTSCDFSLPAALGKQPAGGTTGLRVLAPQFPCLSPLSPTLLHWLDRPGGCSLTFVKIAALPVFSGGRKLRERESECLDWKHGLGISRVVLSLYCISVRPISL